MECVPDLTASLPVIPQRRNHAEICLTQSSIARGNVVIEHVMQYLSSVDVYEGSSFLDFSANQFLRENVRSIVMCSHDVDSSSLHQKIDVTHGNVDYHIFQLNEEGPAMEDMDNEDNMPAANHWILPASEFHGTWDSLIYDTNVKELLLNYAYTTLLFSDRNVDPNLISWNRVILLHGPPGTGKTSLCKALAQKLTIRLSDRFRYGQLLEINSHSLFSKWFSESGKLVLKMFQRIQELIEDKDSLVFILIDEVESLTAARTSAMKGTEPSDSIRVVNALLTQIDQIKSIKHEWRHIIRALLSLYRNRNPNVIILTTSNVTGAIDLAFVDRADIKQYIGPPSVKAIYKIFQSCIKELTEKGVISPPQAILDLRSLEVIRFHENEATRLSLELLKISKRIQGCSGRNLRKLPFLAHALFLQAPTVSLEHFIDGLSCAAEKYLADQEKLDSDPSNLSTKPRKSMPNGEL